MNLVKSSIDSRKGGSLSTNTVEFSKSQVFTIKTYRRPKKKTSIAKNRRTSKHSCVSNDVSDSNVRPFRLHDAPWPSMWQDPWGSASFLLHTDSDGKVHNDLHNTDLQYLKFKYTYADPELRKYRERILHESLPRMLNERWFTANYSML